MKILFLFFLIISMIYSQLGPTFQEYNYANIILRNNIYLKKFSDEVVDGRVYQRILDEYIYMGRVKNGNIDGSWIEWHENGQKKNKSNYINGNLDGYLTIWNENGQRDSKSYFFNGRLDSSWTYYRNGNIKKQEIYKNNIISNIKLFFKNNSLFLSGNFRNGKKYRGEFIEERKRISDLKIFEDSCIVSYKNEQEINISYFGGGTFKYESEPKFFLIQDCRVDSCYDNNEIEDVLINLKEQEKDKSKRKIINQVIQANDSLINLNPMSHNPLSNKIKINIIKEEVEQYINKNKRLNKSLIHEINKLEQKIDKVEKNEAEKENNLKRKFLEGKFLEIKRLERQKPTTIYENNYFRFSYKNLENSQNKNIAILFQNKSLAELSKISFFVVMEKNGAEVFKEEYTLSNISSNQTKEVVIENYIVFNKLKIIPFD